MTMALRRMSLALPVVALLLAAPASCFDTLSVDEPVENNDAKAKGWGVNAGEADAVVAAGKSGGDAMKGVLSAIQGTMLLASALPKQGLQPTDPMENEMAQAGSLSYAANQMLENSEENLGAASERLNTDSTTSESASGIADGEQMIKAAAEKITKSEALARKARSDFQSSAPPLGDPPVEPKAWSHVLAMIDRAHDKLTSLQSRLSDVKRLANNKGVSLMSIQEERATVLSDDYGNRQDNRILDFLNRY